MLRKISYTLIFMFQRQMHKIKSLKNSEGIISKFNLFLSMIIGSLKVSQ